MRKVLSFVLVLSLVLGSFGMAFAAPLSDMAGEKSSEAVNVLTELGVVKGYPDGTYKPDRIVTRAEMAVIVVSALGLADYATGTSSFKDMGGHWSNSFVAYATSLGVIAGYPDGTFRPDKTVSYDEAATMLVAALGYTPDSLTGTWPANYVIKAKTLGILDGIKAGAVGANRGDVAIMTFQTLGKEIGKVNKDGEWKGAADAEDADTMLARLGAELYEGGDAFVVEGGEEAVINLKPYLGAYVKAYQNSDEEIIAIKEVKSVYLTGEKDGDKFEADGTKYTLDATVTGSSLGYDKKVEAFKIENGAEGDFDYDGKEEYTLAVKVSGKKITEVYSVAKWTVNGAFLFEKDMLDDEELNSHEFALDNNDEIDFASFELIGVNSLGDIEEDNVVYVYEADFGDGDVITRIAVGTEVVKGEVTKITSSDPAKITVDGKAYEKGEYKAEFDGFDWADIEIENEVALYLDFEGLVYTAELLDGAKAKDYAIVLASDNPQGLRDEYALLKLFIADGTEKTFKVDTDIKDAQDNDFFADNKWASAPTPGGLVKYGVDKNGIIEALEIVTPDQTNIEGKIYNDGVFNSEYIASNALIFTFAKDGNPSKKDDYGVVSLDKVKGNEYTSPSGIDYVYNDSTDKIDVMIIKGEGGTDDEIYGVITDWYKTSKSDTDFMLEALVDGKVVEYEVTSLAYANLENKKDSKELWQFDFNSSGQVKGFSPLTGVEPTDKEIGLLADGTVAVTLAGNKLVVKVSGETDTTYTVANNALAYKWDDGYSKSSVSKNNLKVGYEVKLYDLSEKGVADLILIIPND